jgi:hypothetical protein
MHGVSFEDAATALLGPMALAREDDDAQGETRFVVVGMYSMSPGARFLIADPDLHPHPEGGYYREIFRSESRVLPGDCRAERGVLTAIFSVGGGPA